MFVLMACWEELTQEEKKLSIPEKIGLTLKHAGVSITVTTVTDVLAFIVGSSTVNYFELPYFKLSKVAIIDTSMSGIVLHLRGNGGYDDVCFRDNFFHSLLRLRSKTTRRQ